MDQDGQRYLKDSPQIINDSPKISDEEFNRVNSLIDDASAVAATDLERFVASICICSYFFQEVKIVRALARISHDNDISFLADQVLLATEMEDISILQDKITWNTVLRLLAYFVSGN